MAKFAWVAGLGCLLCAACGSGSGQPGSGSAGPTCKPITCALAGKNCGTIADGCNSSLDCGVCGAGATCGGGGVANVCGASSTGGGGGGCTPTTCSAQGKNCGSIADGCGATLECGSCGAGTTCGGGGVANVCGTSSTGGGGGGCTPTTCSAQGKNCGSIADNCGGTLQCGTCAEGSACGAANVCAPLPSGSTIWSRAIPGYSPTSGNDVVPDGNGNVIALLHTRSGGMLVKTDVHGKVLWQRPASEAGGNGSFASSRSLAVDPGGAIYLATNTGSVPGGVVEKYGPDGDFWWQQRLAVEVIAIAADATGFAAITARKPNPSSTVDNQADTTIDRRNPDGSLRWTKVLGYRGEIDAFAIAFAPSGDLIVGGRLAGPAQFEQLMSDGTQPPVHGQSGDATPFIARVSGTDGWVLWADSIEATSPNSGAVVVDVGVSAAGTAVAAGYVTQGTFAWAGTSLSSDSNTGYSAFLAVAERDGAPRFLREVGRTVMRALAVDPSGSAYLAIGNSNCHNNISVQHWNLAGAHLWSRSFGGDCAPIAFMDALGWSPASGPVVGGWFENTVDFGDRSWTAEDGSSGVLLRLQP